MLVQTSIVQCCSLKESFKLKINILSLYSPSCSSKPITCYFLGQNVQATEMDSCLYCQALKKDKKALWNFQSLLKPYDNFVWVKITKFKFTDDRSYLLYLANLNWACVFQLCHVMTGHVMSKNQCHLWEHVWRCYFKYKTAQNVILKSMNEIWKKRVCQMKFYFLKTWNVLHKLYGLLSFH